LARAVLIKALGRIGSGSFCVTDLVAPFDDHIFVVCVFAKDIATGVFGAYKQRPTLILTDVSQQFDVKHRKYERDSDAKIPQNLHLVLF
jgi:hypothetical protein